MGISHLIISIAGIKQFGGISVVGSTYVWAHVNKVVGHATLCILKEFLLHSVVVAFVEQAHVSLCGILGILALVPYTTHGVVAMFLRPVILQPIACISLPFVLEVTMMVLHPHLIVIVVDSLLRIVLERLPLCTLFPETTSAIAAVITIAESALEIVGLALEDIVAVGLILERVSNLVGNGRTNRLTSGGIHPKGTDGIVVTRTSGEPLCLIKQVDFHLILVELRLALSGNAHVEFLDVRLVELFCLHQQVVNIHPQFSRNIL